MIMRGLGLQHVIPEAHFFDGAAGSCRQHIEIFTSLRRLPLHPPCGGPLLTLFLPLLYCTSERLLAEPTARLPSLLTTQALDLDHFCTQRASMGTPGPPDDGQDR